MHTLREALVSTPSLFPLNMDANGGVVQFVNLSEFDYIDSSFLDNRLLGPHRRHALIPWQEVHQSSLGIPLRCDFIFHISHAGSTLMSRLLGTHAEVLSIREPMILRMLGQHAFLDRMDTFLGLWSRTFRPEQRPIIKATSFVSEIACLLLDRVPDSKALLMFVSPEVFIPALLSGAMSDITSHAESRLQRLQRRGHSIELTVNQLSPGECVAMSWWAEMLALSEASNQFPDRTRWIDFDAFLVDPHRILESVRDHMRIVAEVDGAAVDATMNRYAKRTEVQYDADFRAQLLRQARCDFASEIANGLNWLDSHRAMATVSVETSNTLG